MIVMKTILIDVDGVVADFTGDLLRAVDSDLTPDDITSWDIFDLLGDGAERARDICRQDDFWRGLSVLPGAYEAVEKLQRDNEIFWVTSPWWSCRTWEHARREWLRRHFGTKPNNVITTSAKHMVCGDVFIDDKPQHVERWAARHPGVAWLYDQPYNRDVSLRRMTWGRQGDFRAQRRMTPRGRAETPGT